MLGGRTYRISVRRPAATVAVFVGLAALIGCTQMQSAIPPQPVPPMTFSQAGVAPRLERWWSAFDDAALSQQVAFAFGGNFSIDAALARFVAAEALAKREASDFFPDVDGVIDLESTFRTRGRDFRSSFYGLVGSYPVDLWGEIQARVDGEELRAQATFENYQAVAITLSADVVATWLALIEANAQLALLDQQIETNQSGLDLQETRWGLGQIRAADVLRQRQLLESTREQVVVVRSRVATLQHLLAVLQGRPPQNAEDDPGMTFPTLPPLPETGLPSDLLQRRPDVRQQFLSLQAADRDFAAAISQQYPRLNITGSLRTAATTPPDRAFQEYFLSIGAQLVGPIIDGGQRRAEVKRTEAVVQALFNDYVQTTLNAFREVEDALVREEYLRQRIERLEQQYELAQRSSEALTEQYVFDSGQVDFISVLSATIDAQRLQRSTLSARLELYLNRVELYRALAGGVDVQAIATDPPTFLSILPDGIESGWSGEETGDEKPTSESDGKALDGEDELPAPELPSSGESMELPDKVIPLNSTIPDFLPRLQTRQDSNGQANALNGPMKSEVWTSERAGWATVQPDEVIDLRNWVDKALQPSRTDGNGIISITGEIEAIDERPAQQAWWRADESDVAD